MSKRVWVLGNFAMPAPSDPRAIAYVPKTELDELRAAIDEALVPLDMVVIGGHIECKCSVWVENAVKLLRTATGKGDA